MVLATTIGVADAIWHETNYPTNLVINAGNPQPWGAAEEVRIAGANLIDGAGVWDSTVIVESNGVVTSARLWVGMGSTLTSGKLIVDGGTWTASSVLHLGIRGPDGLGDEEVNVVEIKNGGMLSIQGLEMTQHDGVFARLIVDNATLSNGGAGWIGQSPSGDAEVTIRNGATGNSGFTAMGGAGAGGSGHTTLNVEGAGSLWTGHTFYMGGGARSASLNITGGGTVLADHFFCSQATTFCDVTISGAGSLLAPGFDVLIGEVGPAQVTIDEGGMFTIGNSGVGLDVSNSGTLIFGLGNGSKIVATGNVVLDDGATIGATADSGFTPAAGVPYDLITSDLTVTANPANLVLDLSALDGNSAAAGFLALNGDGTALQLTLTDTGQGDTTLTQVDNVNVTFFDFNSVLGFEYDLESSTNMADWVFTGLIVTGDGGTMTVFDPTGTDTNKSYRLSITGTGP
jgi:T5SS/PEP-CTERM-associated repeat protein